MRVDDFDYILPEERIALRPASPRDSSKLLHVLGGAGFGQINDKIVRDLPQLLRAGDVLVLNDTRVIPAQLSGVRTRAENTIKFHATLLKRLDAQRWLAFARPARRLAAGDLVQFGDGLSGVVESRTDAQVIIAFDLHGPALDRAIAQYGAMPLPHYIGGKRPLEAIDADDYQTVFARNEGAVAAPTAGLHFTPALLEEMIARGVEIVYVTLHVGAGTFLPVKTEDTSEHEMHAEWCEVSEDAAAHINAAKARGGRIVAVGTTALRTLETASAADGQLRPFMGETSLFILPGFTFHTVDVLMTNFHLPRSTLLMLVSAFAGVETVRQVYSHALHNAYRFYSYGDACLMERAK